MTPRIEKLRNQSLQAVYTISAERAILVTDFYKNYVSLADSIPVQRAKAFHFIMSNKDVCINDDELIVGERGPAPKATPTYPEINLHSLKDLDILNTREKVWFRVDSKTRDTYEQTIIPFWKGKSNRERVMGNMSPEWHDAYNAGIFTEFMEQRAPGHTVAGNKIYRKGMLDIMLDIKESLAKLDFLNDPKAFDRQEELKAMSATTKDPASVAFQENMIQLLSTPGTLKVTFSVSWTLGLEKLFDLFLKMGSLAGLESEFAPKQ